MPKRVFGYQIYMSVPPRLQLRWDARALPDGRIWRSMCLALLIKTRNRADFYSKDNTYCETVNSVRKLYPAVAPELFKF